MSSLNLVLIFLIAMFVLFIIILTIVMVARNSAADQPKRSEKAQQLEWPHQTVQAAPKTVQAAPSNNVSSGPNFCPMCGQKRIQNFIFCSSCGFNYSTGREHLVQPVQREQPAHQQYQTQTQYQPYGNDPYNSQSQYFQRGYPITPSFSRSTPKRVTSVVGLLLIITAGVFAWQSSKIWEGIFNGGYGYHIERGLEVPNGIISTLAALLGLILILAIRNETSAHVLSVICAAVSAFAAISYMSSGNWGYSGGYEGLMVDTYTVGIGVYMVFLGAAIVLCCIFIPSRKA